ncbi:MAG: GGDEF domain-containing protein, partial [Thermoleophilia bacterium]|nr:GGDEF domain-containing protein [Thermoleophilia bacterium]
LASRHDSQNGAEATREDILLRAERNRARAATDRAKAADDRARAAADRAKAADDRARAARDRERAARQRADSADKLKLATTDELTGAWTRKFGLEALSRELERTHRTGEKLLLAFVDVDRLKKVNDRHGHLAGDALLRLVGTTARANLRRYDVIVRYGGDELLCGLPNVNPLEARGRMEKISAAVRGASDGHSVTFGLAAAEPRDTLEDVIARADADLLEARRSRESSH